MKIEMQNKNFFIKAFIIALLTLLVLIAANNLIDFKKHFFEVSAEASIFSKPDLVKIDFDITREANKLSIVRQQLNQASSKLIADLQKLNIQEKNIKTTNYSISPKQSWNRETGESYIYGYRGSITTQVKIKDFNKIDQVVSLGQAKNISFEIENKDELLAKVREEAIAKAKAKAKKIAKETGVHLGKLINISISENTEQSAQIQPGENEIKVRVRLSYEL